MRNICHSELLTVERVRSFGYIRADELTRTFKRLESVVETKVNFRQIMTQTVNNVIVRATLGDIYQDRADLIELLNDVMNGLGETDLLSYYPSLKFLYAISRKKAKWTKTHKKLDVILEETLEEHRNRTSGNKDHEDLLDVLLRIKETGDLDIPIINDNVKAVILDILIAGMGTPTSVIEWAMSELMKNPETMKKAQAEVRAVMKGNTMTETEIQSMHYLNLVIKETLRLHCPPLLVPRVTKEHCNVHGYDIPANTNILINVWALGTDPGSWDNSESFIPERFEDSPIDYMGSNFQYIPFGAGRRICAGMTFGLNMVEHVVASFLYHFDWKLPNGLEPHVVKIELWQLHMKPHAIVKDDTYGNVGRSVKTLAFNLSMMERVRINVAQTLSLGPESFGAIDVHAFKKENSVLASPRQWLIVIPIEIPRLGKGVT